jgi:hypothetical protein
MRKFLMIASAAAMAASMPALAQKGGNGGGNGGGKGHAAHGGGGGGKEARGGGNGGGGHAKPARAERQASHGGRGGGAKPHKAERHAFQGGGKPHKAERQAVRSGSKPSKSERQAFRAPKQERKAVRQTERGFVRVNDVRVGNNVDVGDYRDGDRRYASLGANCPPGLAKKGCMPPGQAKKAFNLGQQVQPAWFRGYNVPAEYSAFYPDSADAYYRYSDEGYIYRIDSQNNLVSGLIPLLGGGFGVGQQMPAGYDVYNVPYQYRDDFYDTDDSLYRYGDDAIYQVDPQSGIIESIVALLGGDLNVGQALPSGYDVYNVPMDYRDQYQDTDQSMYRYADGNIYQVDTKTQIIQAIMEMLV